MTEISTEIQVRYADYDMMGHVNSAAYFTFLETARLRVMLERWQGQVFDAVVARQSCDYRKPIFFNGDVVVTLRVAKVGSTSFELFYRIHDGRGTTYAEATSIMVCFDRKSQKPMPVPECVREML